MIKFLNVTKIVVVLSFVVSLFATYFLRSEVLALSKTGYAADKTAMEYEEKEEKESYPHVLKEHEVKMKNYHLKMDHYKKQIELYESDYEKYSEQAQKGSFGPPQLPSLPVKPKPPEYRKDMLEIKHDFRMQRMNYYSKTYVLNWVACGAAMLLAGGLITLILFEQGVQKFAYLAVLIVSFVFMIGPSFHSLLSALISYMQVP